MGIERRRGQRVPVTGVTGVVHSTFGASLVSLQPEGFTVEATRPLRVGKRYGFAARTAANPPAKLNGMVTSCRLASVRPASAGSSVSIYEAAVCLDPGSHAADLDAGEQLTGDAAYATTVRVLSASGALLETEIELLVGSSCRVELLLSGSTFSSRACVVFLHEIAEVAGTIHYHLGVEFHNTSPESIEALDAFIASLTA